MSAIPLTWGPSYSLSFVLPTMDVQEDTAPLENVVNLWKTAVARLRPALSVKLVQVVRSLTRLNRTCATVLTAGAPCLTVSTLVVMKSRCFVTTKLDVVFPLAPGTRKQSVITDSLANRRLALMTCVTCLSGPQ